MRSPVRVGGVHAVLAACIAAGVWGLGSARAHADTPLAVVEVRWGFDGTIRAGAFNPLAIRVANVGRARVEGVLQLERKSFAGRGGGVQRAECFLDAGQDRWFRFYPLVLGAREGWVLADGRGLDEELPETKVGAPACVVFAALRDRGARSRSTTGLALFPDELFPPTAAATGGLAAVVLDHAPELLAPQRQALVDWVAMGGILHLVPDERGELPRLEGELGVLAGSLEDQPYGAGRVLRHPQLSGPIAREALVELMPPLPSLPTDTPYGEDVAPRAFGALERFTRADHNWTAIYLLAALYFGLIGPGCAVMARRSRSHLVPNGITLGLVLLFGFLFGEVGRRGYGERESIHAVCYARSLGGDRYDVLEYGNTFVTSSGRYEIAFDTPFTLIGTGIADESVDATLRCGLDGGMSSLVPLFSARGFAFRGTLKGPALDPKVERWESDAKGALRTLAIRLAAAPEVEVLECLCRHRGTYHRMNVVGTAIELGGGRADVKAHEANSYANTRRRSINPAETAALKRALAHLLIVDAHGGGDELPNRLVVPDLPDEEAELFLVVSSPSGFLPKISSARTQDGVAVLTYRLRRPRP